MKKLTKAAIKRRSDEYSAQYEPIVRGWLDTSVIKSGVVKLPDGKTMSVDNYVKMKAKEIANSPNKWRYPHVNAKTPSVVSKTPETSSLVEEVESPSIEPSTHTPEPKTANEVQSDATDGAKQLNFLENAVEESEPEK